MSNPMTETERKALLSSIGLNPEAEGLVAIEPTYDEPAKPKKKGKKAKKAKAVEEVAAPTHEPKKKGRGPIKIAPKGVDPHTMPVEDIVFDERLLDNFASLAFNQQGKAASDYVFSLYKSVGKNKDRNSALHTRIASFITLTRRNRETGGMVKEKVASTKEQRDLSAVLASQGLSAGDLAEAIRLLQAQRDAKA